MHVDGFRFDLASVMSRDSGGKLLKDPPILWDIESDPTLAGTKIIAEAWDAGGLYQVGSFTGHRWAEWNGQYRDDVRRFICGQAGHRSQARPALDRQPGLCTPSRRASRTAASTSSPVTMALPSTICARTTASTTRTTGRTTATATTRTIAAATAPKGQPHDPALEALRLRQCKNLMTILLTSQGTPMLLMGDEVRRTQGGNNNAYCQDNEISWFDWEDVSPPRRHAALRPRD